MKLKHHVLAGSAVLSLLALSSCIKDEYDLSDIDTTVRLQTKELTVPINLDYLTLDQVMDLNDDSEIVKETQPDGSIIYAVKKEGTFDSDPIHVAAFATDKPSISPSVKTLTITPLPVVLPTDPLAKYPIPIDVSASTFSVNASDIDKAIKQMDLLGATSKFKVVIEVTPIGGTLNWSNVKFEGIKIEVPKGLLGTSDQGTFIPNSSATDAYGLLDLSATPLQPDATGKVTINIDVTGIDVPKSNAVIDYTAHTLALADQIRIKEGDVVIYGSSTGTTLLPPSVTFSLAPDMDAIQVNTFTGRIEYDVDAFDIDPIDLSNLPDFLSQSGTQLGLEKPQIYLGLNNPVGNVSDGAGGYMFLRTGIVMTPERDGVAAAPCGLDNTTFDVTGDGTTAEQYFVMAPAASTSFNYPGYTNPTFVPFAALKDVLTETDGIPTKIKVEAVNPQLPNQPVQNFQLDTDLPKIDGKYAFYAPLQLTNNSVIMYTDTIDGWNDEDVDAINVNEMLVNFDLTSEIPFDLTLDIIPITLNGKEIPSNHNKVTIPASATNFPVAVTITAKDNSPITHLDGLLVKAKVDHPQAETLAPEMKLHLKNSKVTLTGYYEKEL